MSEIMKFENLQDHIIEIRDQKVLLGVGVAEIYGVETKRINEAVKIIPTSFHPDTTSSWIRLSGMD